MRIIIDIPKEFENDFRNNKFEDALNRLCMDAHLVAGNYERETAEMLIKAFNESTSIDRIVEQLEESVAYYKKYGDSDGLQYTAYESAIEIVKAGED